MNIESLAASAAINIGLALVILSLFSVLKKRPSNAPVYYARRLARRDDLLDVSAGLHLLPSVSWIPRALRISEDDIVRDCGLDALVIIRLFKFGIKLFLVCSLIGLLILVPVNFICQQGPSQSTLSYSMDPFTISNVRRGSNWLWVHFSCLYIISFYTFYLLYKEYSEILKKRIQCINTCRDRPDQFTVLVRGVPVCEDHKARGCCVDHFFSKHYPHSYELSQVVHNGENIEELLHLAVSMERKIQNLRQQEISKKHQSRSLFSSKLGDIVAQIQSYDEKLHEICQKIRHLQCENVLKQKELPVAFVSFKTRRGAALASQSQQHAHPLVWITESAPEPRDVLWNNLAIPYRRVILHKVVVFIAASILTLFFTLPVTAVQGIVRFEKLKKWFPPIRAVQLIPGLTSILTGYLPSVILNCFIYVAPYVMLWIASLEGCISRSRMEIKACNMVFYFLVGNVFFLSLLSGSLLDQIGESFAHPKHIPSRLASAVSSQADFFITYILTDGLSGFSLEILQIGMVLWHLMKSHTFWRATKSEPYLYSLQYYRVIPFVSLAILIGIAYAVVAPLLLPFLIIYLLLGYAVYVNQDVYEIIYETYGQYWPYVHHYICVALMLMQITMIGLFGLKLKPAASISTIPLLVITMFFNEYCKTRFLPTFFHSPIQIATENDDQDVAEGLTDRYENVINAYRAPWLRPLNVNLQEECSSIEPLVVSS